MKVKRSQVGWGFWLQWVLASTVGCFLGFLIVFILDMLTILIVEDVIESGVLVVLLSSSMLGAALGSVVSGMQWLVMRRHVSRAGRWVLASTAGFAVAVGGGYGTAGVAFGSSEGVGEAIVMVGGDRGRGLGWGCDGHIAVACPAGAGLPSWLVGVGKHRGLGVGHGSDGSFGALFGDLRGAGRRGSAGSDYGRSLSLAVATTRTRSLVGV